MLNWEIKEKYLNEFQARFNSGLEIRSLPICFDKCINDMTTVGMSSDEKNCMRECTLKRISSRDDMSMLIQQKLTIEQQKSIKDMVV